MLRAMTDANYDSQMDAVEREKPETQKLAVCPIAHRRAFSTATIERVYDYEITGLLSDARHLP